MLSSHHLASLYEIWKLYVKNYWRNCVRTKLVTKLKSSLDLWTPKCISMFSHHPASMYEIWKLYVENYLSYRIRSKVLTKFRCDLDLWPFDPKSIGVFLSLSYICAWNIKFVGWEIVELSHYNEVLTDRVDKVQLWPWPLTFWPQNL